jgi:hypothetical protein
VLCALRARFKSIIAGGSAPAPWVTFLCLSKEKSPKETTPRSARRFTKRSGPLRSSPHRALANSPGACTRGAPIRGAPVRRHGSPPDFHEYSASPSGSNTGSLKISRWGCGTRRALRGPKKQNISMPCLTGRLRNRNMPCFTLLNAVHVCDYLNINDSLLSCYLGYTVVLKSNF